MTSLHDTTLTKVTYGKYATRVPDEVAYGIYSSPYNNCGYYGGHKPRTFGRINEREQAKVCEIFTQVEIKICGSLRLFRSLRKSGQAFLVYAAPVIAANMAYKYRRRVECLLVKLPEHVYES